MNKINDTSVPVVTATESKPNRRQFIGDVLTSGVIGAGVMLLTQNLFESKRDARNTFYEPEVNDLKKDQIAAIREKLSSLTDASQFMEEYGRSISDSPLRHKLLEYYKKAGWDGETRYKLFLDDFGINNPEMYPMCDYDSSWMRDFFCNNYLWHLLRREEHEADIIGLVNDPSQNTNCAYLPVIEPQDFDVVAYFSLTTQNYGQGPFNIWLDGHVGLWFDGMVISKNNTGNVFRHVLNGVEAVEDSEKQRVVFFRKFGSEDPRGLPIPPVKFSDWVYDSGGVFRANQPKVVTDKLNTGLGVASMGIGMATAFGVQVLRSTLRSD